MGKMEILLTSITLMKEVKIINPKVPMLTKSRVIDLAGQKCNFNFLTSILLSRVITSIVANSIKPLPTPVAVKATAIIVGMKIP
jgi:hypothetical protein